MTLDGWNYRVTVTRYEPAPGVHEDLYELREVYYEGDRVSMWTANAIAPSGESVEDLRANLAQMEQAFTRPTLDLGPATSRSVER